VLDDNAVEVGLVPIFVHPETGRFTTSEIRLGSRGDAYYGQFSHSPPPPPPPNPLPLSSLPRDVYLTIHTLEYLIKQYLQTWGMEPIYLEMWEGDVSCLRWTT